jgi:hypothetical protein
MKRRKWWSRVEENNNSIPISNCAECRALAWSSSVHCSFQALFFNDEKAPFPCTDPRSTLTLYVSRIMKTSPALNRNLRYVFRFNVSESILLFKDPFLAQQEIRSIRNELAINISSNFLISLLYTQRIDEQLSLYAWACASARNLPWKADIEDINCYFEVYVKQLQVLSIIRLVIVCRACC